MAITLNDNIDAKAPKPLDKYEGPYASIAEAIAAVPSALLYNGRTVLVLENGKSVEYWWADGVNLTKKSITNKIDNELTVNGAVQSKYPYGIVVNYDQSRDPKLTYNERVVVVADPLAEYGFSLKLPAGSAAAGARPFYGPYVALENGVYNWTVFMRISDNTKPGTLFFVDINETGPSGARGSIASKTVKYSDFDANPSVWTAIIINFTARKGYNYEARTDIAYDAVQRFPTLVDIWLDYGVLSPFTASVTRNPDDYLLNRANHTGTQAASTIQDDTTRRFVTDAEKATWNGKQNALGFTPVDVATKGAANGIAPLDENGKVAATYLPSYVDDVLEFSSLSAFPANGESGKIYIATNTNYTYRWGGTTYVQITASPGSTDAVPEGATNKYFTDARAQAANAAAIGAKLTGTAATDAETQIAAAVAEDSKFISRLKLFNWWAWIKGQAATVTGNWNFTGTLKKNGADVLTSADVDVTAKLNVGANAGLANTGGTATAYRMTIVGPDGTLMADQNLSYDFATKTFYMGQAGTPGKLYIYSNISRIQVQPDVASGSADLTFNDNQAKAFVFRSTDNKEYMAFRTTDSDEAVILLQKWLFDMGVFAPLSNYQGKCSTASNTKTYFLDTANAPVRYPLAMDGTVVTFRGVVRGVNSGGTIGNTPLVAEFFVTVKRIAGAISVHKAETLIKSDFASPTNFSISAEGVDDGTGNFNSIQFFVQPNTAVAMDWVMGKMEIF